MISRTIAYAFIFCEIPGNQICHASPKESRLAVHTLVLYCMSRDVLFVQNFLLDVNLLYTFSHRTYHCSLAIVCSSAKKLFIPQLIYRSSFLHYLSSMEKLLTTRELFNLHHVTGGLSSGALTYKNLDLGGTEMAVVMDPEQGCVLLVDLLTRTDTRLPIKEADSSSSQPQENLLAVRTAQQMQLYNLESKTRVQSVSAPDPIVYWRWIRPRAMVVVTTSAVYHWDTANESQPLAKVFDRAQEIADCAILSYAVDDGMKWHALLAVVRDAEGQLCGKAQLYSVEKQASKVIEGHQASFRKLTAQDGVVSNILCVASNSGQGGRLLIMEVPTAEKQATTFERKVVPVSFASTQDFPIVTHLSTRMGLIFVVSRDGTFHAFDVYSGAPVFSEQVSNQTVFKCTFNESDELVLVNSGGTIYRVNIDERALVTHLQAQVGNTDLALRVAVSAGLPGATQMLENKVRGQLQTLDVEGAIDTVIKAPNKALRTQEMIQIFTQAGQQHPNLQPPPVSTYYKAMIAHGGLTQVESVAFAMTVLPRGGLQVFKNFMEEKKITESEELGDVISTHDRETALKIYHRCECPSKVLQTLVAMGDLSKVSAYCEKVNYVPEWGSILKGCIETDPDVAVTMGVMVHNLPNHGNVNPSDVVEHFLRNQSVKQLTLYLLDILKGDREEDRTLQTKLLEINIKHSPPQVAEQIFSQGVLSHYDDYAIAALCEKAQMYSRAVEHYGRAEAKSDHAVSFMNEIKRCIPHLKGYGPDWYVEFFGTLNEVDGMEFIKELMEVNSEQNAKICVQLAAKYHTLLGTEPLINLFLKHRNFEALSYFLGSILQGSSDPDVHFRYLEASYHLGNLKEVERMTRESNFYDAERTKNFLMDQKLQDLWPLINVCEKHELYDAMVKYLYETGNMQYLEEFVQKKHPIKTPFIIGALMDCNCSEDYIRSLLTSVGSLCPSEALIAEVEQRHRLGLLQSWLEDRVQEKSSESVIHTALAKLYIDQGKALDFLENNEHYDARLIGKYSENRDPALALIAYRRANSDKDLIRLCRSHGMFKQLARHLVQKKDSDLWKVALIEEINRKYLVDAVVQTAFPETNSPEEISTAVKAFIQADLPEELAALLEKIVLHGSKEFRANKYLQNLLMITAIKAAQDKAMDYATRLENYDVQEIAAAAKQAGLFDVAFTAYKKFQLYDEAVEVLLHDMNSLTRAVEFAEWCDRTEVWTLVGAAWLKKGDITEAVQSFIRAKDPHFAQEVAEVASRQNKHEDLVKYLHMARSESKHGDAKIDTELAYALARVGNMMELEEFVSSAHKANLVHVADKCYTEEMFDAARILYQACSHFPRLASTLCHLQNFAAAVEAAQRANNVEVWKKVNRACIENSELQLAKVCALAMVQHADELEGLIAYYETHGYYQDVIHLLQAAATSSVAHIGIFTELAVLYAKYSPENLIEHIRLYNKRMNMHKVVASCKKYQLWVEMCALYQCNNDFEGAASVVLEHSAVAWEHIGFTELLNKVDSTAVLYEAVIFYIRYHPDLVNELLLSIGSRLDTERVVNEVTRLGHLPLIKPFLLSVQSRNIQKVNEALQDMWIEEEDPQSLCDAVAKHTNFDILRLGHRLENHPHVSFRRTAAILFRRTGRFRHAIDVQKKDRLHSDAMETAAESADKTLVEDLLRWVVCEDLPDCFSACLATCYEWVEPDVALELAWRSNMQDFVMPYMITCLHEYGSRMRQLEAQLAEQKKTTGTPTALSSVTPPLITSNASGDSLAAGYHQNIGQLYPAPGSATMY